MASRSSISELGQDGLLYFGISCAAASPFPPAYRRMGMSQLRILKLNGGSFRNYARGIIIY